MKRQPETRHAGLVLSSFPTTFVSTVPPFLSLLDQATLCMRFIRNDINTVTIIPIAWFIFKSAKMETVMLHSILI